MDKKLQKKALALRFEEAVFAKDLAYSCVKLHRTVEVRVVQILVLILTFVISLWGQFDAWFESQVNQYHVALFHSYFEFATRFRSCGAHVINLIEKASLGVHNTFIEALDELWDEVERRELAQFHANF